MNIKSVHTPPIIPIDPKRPINGHVKAEHSTERDANGRRERDQDEPKRHLSEEEFADAINYLKSLPSLRSGELSIRVESLDGRRIALILDSTGSVVRRLSEADLWMSCQDKDRATGRILDRAG